VNINKKTSTSKNIHTDLQWHLITKSSMHIIQCKASLAIFIMASSAAGTYENYVEEMLYKFTF